MSPVRRFALALGLVFVSRALGVEAVLLPRRQVLAPCATYLGDGDSVFRKTLIRQFSAFELVDDPARLGHHDFHLRAPTGRQLAQDPTRVRLLDLDHNESRWRRERWTSPHLNTPFWMMEVGFRSLEDDAASMNALVSGVLLESDSALVHFYSSPARVRDLERLSTFRWACWERVMRRYREHRYKQKYLGEIDFKQFREADRRNLNVDVFAVSNVALEWCAASEDVEDALSSTIQVTYPQPWDPIRPSFDGLLAANNEFPTEEERLPFMERLAPAAKEDFLLRFRRDFQGQVVCEITRYINTRTPEVIVAQLLLNVLERVRERGCDVAVASLDPFSMRRFGRYGFASDRPLPTMGSANENLAVLRVRSGAFAATLLQLRNVARDLSIANE